MEWVKEKRAELEKGEIEEKDLKGYLKEKLEDDNVPK